MIDSITNICVQSVADHVLSKFGLRTSFEWRFKKLSWFIIIYSTEKLNNPLKQRIKRSVLKHIKNNYNLMKFRFMFVIKPGEGFRLVKHFMGANEKH